jgi:hypothetical protein
MGILVNVHCMVWGYDAKELDYEEKENEVGREIWKAERRFFALFLKFLGKRVAERMT